MERGKKGVISTTWERCKSIGGASPGIKRFLLRKSKSWPRKGRVAAEGCFTVYVGAERERFVVRTEYANHPLFRVLLEEAEAEFGYNSQAPLWLPCEVESFCRVLMEMDDGSDDRFGCGYTKRFGSYHLLSPSRSLPLNRLHF